MSEHRCPACGKIIVRRPGEKPSHFAARKCCDYACSGAASHIGRSHDLTCPFCRARPRQKRAKGCDLYATCGDPKCTTAARAGYLNGRHGKQPQWPAITGEVDWGNGFAAHEIEPGDGGVLRVGRPDSRSYTSSSAAWAYARGVE